MGILKAIFGDGFSRHHQAGDKFFQSGQYGMAKGEYETALARFNPSRHLPADKERVEDSLHRTRQLLACQQLERAEELIGGDLLDDAQDLLDLAMDLTESEELQEKILHSVRRLDRIRQGEEDVPPAALPTNLVEELKGDAEPDPGAGATREQQSAGDDSGRKPQHCAPGSSSDQIDEGDADLMMGEGDNPIDIYLLHMTEEKADIYRSLGRHFEEGYVALQEGEGERAVALLQKALEGDGEAPWIHLELGRAFLFTGDHQGAVRHLEQYHRQFPNHPEPAYTMAEALRGAGDPGAAQAIFQQQVRQRPDSPRALLMLAEFHLVQEQWEEATSRAMEALSALATLMEGEKPGKGDGRLAGGGSDLGSIGGSSCTSCAPSDIKEASAGSGDPEEEEPPSQIMLLRTIAKGQVGSGREEEAIATLERIMKLYWRYDCDSCSLQFDRESAWVLASLYLKLQRRPERAVDLLHAIEHECSEEERPLVLARLAQAYHAAKRATEGRKYLSLATSLLGELDDELREKVSSVLQELGTPPSA